MFPCLSTCLRIWPRETVSAVPSRVSPLILHTQAESSIINHQSSIINHQSSIINHQSGAYSQNSSRLPRRRPHIFFNRHTLVGQSGVYLATQLRVNGVYCRESAGTGPVGLKVVPVTGATTLQVTMDQLLCASLFPHIHHWYEVGTLIEGVIISGSYNHPCTRRVPHA